MQEKMEENIKSMETVDNLANTFLDKNEAMFDYDEKFLYGKAVYDLEKECHESLFTELMDKTELCQHIFNIYVQQRILINQPRIRFKPGNNLTELHSQCDLSDLSKDMKDFIRIASLACYKLLDDQDLVSYFVELDSERVIRLIFKQKRTNFQGISNFVCLQNSETLNGCSRLERGVTSTMVNYMFVLRNQMPATQIFKQCLLRTMHQVDTIYLIVCHLGPIVAKQEMVLYQYTISDDMQTAIINKDLDEMMKAWIQNEGKLVRKQTDLKDYLKHSIFSHSIPSKSCVKKRHRRKNVHE